MDPSLRHQRQRLDDAVVTEMYDTNRPSEPECVDRRGPQENRLGASPTHAEKAA
jgi:hypothetical protein